jgi:hypothetical protein
LLADSTTIFPSKNSEGITAQITFCRKINKLSGKPIESESVFAIRENETVYSLIDISSPNRDDDRPLMFHLQWIDPEGNSIFLKRIDLYPEDSSSTFKSSISASPDKRQPGDYRLRFYLFRELIAEKDFKLLPGSEVPTLAEKLDINLSFSRKTDKKTGERIGIDTVFKIKDKARVQGFADVGNLENIPAEGAELRFDWIEPSGKSFYQKSLELIPGNPGSTAASSISISPDKRQPGDYLLRLYLNDEIAGEKKFYLR